MPSDVFIRTIEDTLTCDVLVIGSGVAGYCAAIQASREGCDTILIEKDEVLGGNSSPNLGVGITGADRHNAFGSETGIIHEIHETQAWVNGFTPVTKGAMPYNISRRGEAVVQSALEEAGVRVFKRHYARAPRMDGSRIVGVIVEDTAAFRTIEIRVSGVVIEASGDGQIGVLAGADYDTGSEAASEYGERSAPTERRSWVQGTSLVALAIKRPEPIEFIPPPGTPEYTPRLWHGRIATHIRHGHGDFRPGRDLVFLYMTEAGGDMDTVDDDGRIYEMLLKQLWAEWNHVKNGPHAEEAKYWDLLWVSPKAGKRESRRLLGDVILTQTDLEAGRRFPDDIAFGGHDLDDHQSLGAVGSNIFGHSIPPMYGIPYRSCYSRNIENLLLAGRLISATHLAHSSVRVMRTGGAIGQAVGIAAATCVKKNTTPRGVYEQHLAELQHTLMRRDGTILARSIDESDDLAQTAKITATSETRFNEQRPGHRAPLVAPAGNVLWDWPTHIDAVEMYLRNDSAEPRSMKLSILRSRRDPPWTTGEIWDRTRWNDLRDDEFRVITKQVFELLPNADGWHRVVFDNPIELDPKDPVSDADRIIIALNEDKTVWWALAEDKYEIAEMVEHSHHDTVWHNLGVMGTMRVFPEIPLGEATNVANGFHRRFSRGPTNVWSSRDPVPQAITLEWPAPVTIRRVELMFDNLVASRHDHPWERGDRVHPMLAKEYTLEARVDGAWHEIVVERCNIHRFRVHDFDAVATDQLRLTVHANHGDGGSARVYRIGVYEE